jgi:hypothetical protein
MSNSFALTDQTVMGSYRVLVGTLTMGDGAGGDAVATGLQNVLFAVDNSTTQAHISHTAGAILPTTAASGASIEVMIFGR